MAAKTFTRDEVAKNNTEDSLWTIIDSKVYDLTEFVDAHPGGESVLRQIAGTDATVDFYNLHRQEVLVKYADLAIGTIKGEKSQVIEMKPGDISLVPYAEPTWIAPQFHSPYFNESHRNLQKAVRIFTDEEVTPEAQAKELNGEHISQHLIDRMAETELLAMRLGPGKHLKGRKLLGGVKPEEFDYFHDMIIAQEMVRSSARGFQDGKTIIATAHVTM
jgi:Cytochrome b5-like Heme/Steroid binding domain/Acyl-CoA dehydrogenase, N-terminal domain